MKSAQEVDEDIQDTEEYVEESLSLDEVEKEMIRKALEKHHGKRKKCGSRFEYIGAYAIQKDKKNMDWIKKITLISALAGLVCAVVSCRISMGLAPISSIDYSKVKTITIAEFPNRVRVRVCSHDYGSLNPET